MKMNPEKWRELIYRLRKQMGLTQAEFAEAVGLSKDCITSWECGRNDVSETSALRVSARLGVNVHDGTLGPVTLACLVGPRVRDFERKLERALGGDGSAGRTIKAAAIRAAALIEKQDDETPGGMNDDH